MNLNRIVFPMVGALGLMGFAQASIVIDDFDVTNSNVSFLAAGNSQLTLAAGGFASAPQRQLEFQDVVNVTNPWTGSYGGSALTITRGDGDANFAVNYAFNFADLGNNGRAINIAGMTKVKFTFGAGTALTNLVVESWGFDAGWSNFGGRNYLAQYAGGAGTLEVDLMGPNPNWNGGLNLDTQSAGILLFKVNPVFSGDSTVLTKIELVPEPASMAAIGVGLVGLAARRRKKA